MGKTVIDSSNKRSQIVKKILAGIGGGTDQPKKYSAVEYRAKLEKVSIWSDEDIKALKEAGTSIKFKPAEW
jgi:hypothetical protein